MLKIRFHFTFTFSQWQILRLSSGLIRSSSRHAFVPDGTIGRSDLSQTCMPVSNFNRCEEVLIWPITLRRPCGRQNIYRWGPIIILYCGLCRKKERKKEILTSFKRPKWPIRPNKRLHLNRERDNSKMIESIITISRNNGECISIKYLQPLYATIFAHLSEVSAHNLPYTKRWSHDIWFRFCNIPIRQLKTYVRLVIIKLFIVCAIQIWIQVDKRYLHLLHVYQPRSRRKLRR